MISVELINDTQSSVKRMRSQMLSPQADRIFYILFPRSHNFSTTECNCFKNLQKARCGARALTQFYKSESRLF